MRKKKNNQTESGFYGERTEHWGGDKISRLRRGKIFWGDFTHWGGKEAQRFDGGFTAVSGGGKRWIDTAGKGTERNPWTMWNADWKWEGMALWLAKPALEVKNRGWDGENMGRKIPTVREKEGGSGSDTKAALASSGQNQVGGKIFLEWMFYAFAQRKTRGIASGWEGGK